jgi:hypothetical protein
MGSIVRTVKPERPWWLMTGFWICVVISLAVVVRRLAALARPSSGGSGSPMANLDATFASHAALTMGHIIPAALFVLVAVKVLLRPKGSVWWERAFFLLGAVTGLTAYAMSGYAVGGWVERSAVLVFDSWFLWSLGRALRFFLDADRERKREWMTRAVGVLLGIATTRPVMGVFFATRVVTGWTPEQFFGFAFWIGFSINALVVEIWLRRRRRRVVVI